jgi:hypothetical protein
VRLVNGQADQPVQLEEIGTVTESSVTIEIVRGERTIRIQESFFGEDLVSETETERALNRMVSAIVQAL